MPLARNFNYRTDHNNPEQLRVRRQSIPPLNESERDEFSDFTERNSGTVVAVRHTDAVHRFLNMTLEIYVQVCVEIAAYTIIKQ